MGNTINRYNDFKAYENRVKRAISLKKSYEAEQYGCEVFETEEQRAQNIQFINKYIEYIPSNNNKAPN